MILAIHLELKSRVQLYQSVKLLHFLESILFSKSVDDSFFLLATNFSYSTNLQDNCMASESKVGNEVNNPASTYSSGGD